MASVHGRGSFRPIEELRKALVRYCSGNYDIAIGSRALEESLIGVRQPGYREAFGRFFNRVMRVATGLRISDTRSADSSFFGEQ